MDEYRRDYEFLPFRTRFFDDTAVIFTYFGTWMSMDKSTYDRFRFGKIDDALYSDLEEHLVIKTGKNAKSIERFVSEFNWNKGKGPTLHIIIPTLRCNQTCRYCYAFRVTEDAHGYDMDEDTARATIDFIFSTPSETYALEFTGGEPLLRFELLKFMISYSTDLAVRKNKTLLFSVVTNGTLLTEEMLDFFGKNNVSICISLDGPEDIHNGNRRFTALPEKNNHATVVGKISLLRSIGYPHLNALPVITRDSLGRWKDIVDEYVSRGFKVFRFKYLSKFGFATGNWNNIGYSPEEYIRAWKEVIDYMLCLNKNGTFIVEHLATMMLKRIFGINPGYCELDMPCGAVIGQLLYNHDGKIYTCDEGRTMDEFSIGDVHSSSYQDILEHPISKMIVSLSSNQSFGCTDCEFFSYCGTCPIENYRSEGTFMVNYPSSYRCRIHKAMFEHLFKKMLSSEEDFEILKRWTGMRENESLNIAVLRYDSKKSSYK